MPEFEFDPISGRMIPTYDQPRSLAGQAMSGLRGGFGSVFGSGRNTTAGDSSMPAGAVEQPLPTTPAMPMGPSFSSDDDPMFPRGPYVSEATLPQTPPEPTVAIQPPGPPPLNPATPPPVPPAPPVVASPQVTAPGVAPPDPALVGALTPPTAPAPVAGPTTPPVAPVGALAAPTAAPPPAPVAAADPNDIDAFGARLIPRESGGRPEVQNREGYTGLYQFGAPRLQTLGMYTPGANEDVRNGWSGQGDRRWSGTFNIPGHEGVRTIEDFRRNPEAQRAAFGTHVADIDRAIDAIPGSSAFDHNGLRAVAHLGGNEGMARFVASGGQANPSDSNGTSLANYYRRFSGSDAPPRDGRPATPGAAPASTEQAEAAKTNLGGDPAKMGDTDGRGPPPPGMSAQAWFGLSAGLFGGRNLMDGMSRGLAGMNEQTRMDQAQQTAAGVRQDARLDRNAQQAETNAYRRAQLGVAQQRANQAGTAAADRAAGRGNETRGAPQPFLDPQTSIGYTGVTYANGRVEVRDRSNNVVTDPDILNRLMRPQDSGDTATRGAQGRADVEAIGNIRSDVETTRASATAAANLRTVLTENPTLVGASWRSQGSRYVAQAMGVPVDGRSPEQIDAAMRQFATISANEIRTQSALFRPMSDTDVRTIMRNVPTMESSPENIRTWLDTVDRTHGRAMARATALNDLQANPQMAAAARRAEGGLTAWISRFDAEYDRNNRPAANQATIQPATTGPGFTSRTGTGVGFTLN